MAARTRAMVVAALAAIALAALLVHLWPGGQGSPARASAAGDSAAATASSAVAASTSARRSSAPPSPTATAPAARSRSQGAVRTTLSAAELTADLKRIFGSGDSFSVAGYDLSTGRSLAVGATSGMKEASVVKLDILQTALYQQQLGKTLNQGNAVAMMDHSDNAAADRIFQAVGGNTGLSQYNALVGLQHTVLDPSGAWGLSTTSAGDQVRLMKQLVSTTSPLNAASRQAALQLMSQVEADQDWGISAAADSGATSELKNGWLNIDSDGGLWAVNSVGLTTAGGHQVLLAVLSQHQPDYQTGVQRVQQAVRELTAALG